jgi:hypothetical protein
MSPFRSTFANKVNKTSTDTRLIAASLFVIASTAAVSNAAVSSAQNESKKDSSAKLEVYMMDRIAQTPYLNNSFLVHNSSHITRHHKRSSENHSLDASINTRPKGVPSRLRILAINVPLQNAFKDGICQQPSKIFEGAVDPVFKDGVAKSKQIDHTAFHESQTRKERRELRKPIEQKSLAKMLYYCYGSEQSSKDTNSDVIDPVIGVEILEVSIVNLNPNNIRRTYTSKSAYKYDPGKYSDNSGQNSSDEKCSKSLQRHETDSGIADVEETNELVDENALTNDATTESDTIIGEIDKNQDYRTAPWNQFAWLEEMHLRVRNFALLSCLSFFETLTYLLLCVTDTWTCTFQCASTTIINALQQHLWPGL